MSTKRILGHHAPPPRLTRTALRLFLIWIAAPLVGLLFALDLLFWLL